MRHALLALVLLAPSLALADPPGAAVPAPVLEAVRSAPLEQPTPPVLEAVPLEVAPVTLTPERLTLILRGLDGAIGQVRRDLGVPAVQIPPEFWQTRGGQALAIGLAVGAASVSAGLTAVTIWQAVK